MENISWYWSTSNSSIVLTDVSSFIHGQAIWAKYCSSTWLWNIHKESIKSSLQEEQKWNMFPYKTSEHNILWFLLILSDQMVKEKKKKHFWCSDMVSDRNVWYLEVMCLLWTFRKLFFIKFEQLAGAMALKYVSKFCDLKNMHKWDFFHFISL